MSLTWHAGSVAAGPKAAILLSPVRTNLAPPCGPFACPFPLFVGNARGGRTAAVLSSLTSTCRRHAIDPQRYLTHLLTNLPATPMSQLDQWLPDAWKRHQAAATIA